MSHRDRLKKLVGIASPPLQPAIASPPQAVQQPSKVASPRVTPPVTPPQAPIVPLQPTPSYIPLSLHKSSVAIAGMHLLVSAAYGPSFKDCFDISDLAYDHPFQTPDTPYVLRWSNLGVAKSMYQAGASKNNQNRPMEDVATETLGSWYNEARGNQSRQYRTNSAKMMHDQCFSVDIDPTYYLLEGDIPSTSVADADARFNALVEETSFAALNSMLALVQSCGLVEGIDYDLANEAKDTVEDTLPSTRTRAIYLAPHVIQNDRFMTLFIRSKLFIATVQSFVKYQLPHMMSTIAEAEHGQHFFVQVIGFASYAQTKASNFDYSHFESRQLALREWNKSNVYTRPLAGLYFVQRRALASFAEPIDAVVRIGEKLFQSDKYLGLFMPVFVHTTDNPKDGYFGKVAYDARFSINEGVDEAIWLRYLTEPLSDVNAEQRRSKKVDSFSNLQKRTRLPRVLWQKAVLASPVPQFRVDEFAWRGKSTKVLGKGGFGYVLLLDWVQTDQMNSLDPTRHHLFRHFAMLTACLQQQLEIILQIEGLKASGAHYAAAKLQASLVNAAVKRIVCVIGGVVQEYDLVDKHSTVQDYAEVMTLVAQVMTTQMGGRRKAKTLSKFFEDLGIPIVLPEHPVVQISTEIDATLVLKMSLANSLRMIQEECLAEILSGLDLGVDDDYFDPLSMRVKSDNMQRPPHYIDLVNTGETFVWRLQGAALQTTTFDADGSLLKFDYYEMPEVKCIGVDKVFALFKDQKLEPLSRDDVLPCYGRCFDNANFMQVLPIMHLGSLESALRKQVMDPPLNQVIVNSSWQAKLARRTNDGLPRPISCYELIGILYDAIRGTNYINACGVRHADIKAPNVLIWENRRAVVSDMGLSRPYGTSPGNAGTPGYVPTRVSNSTYANSNLATDATMDAYAFGRMMDLTWSIYYNDKNKQVYNTALSLSIVGTCFNKSMASATHNSWPMIATSGLTRFTNDDSKIPVSQLPISQELATAIMQTWREISKFLTDPVYTTDVIEKQEGIAMSSSIIDELDTFVPIINLVEHQSYSLYGHNLLRAMEAVLLCQMACIEAEVRSVWGANVAD